MTRRTMMNEQILSYLQNYWDDLHYWIEGQGEIDSVNHWTCGTPGFETIKEARTYLDELDKTIKALKVIQDLFRKPMSNEAFIDEMRTIAFGESETRHEHSLEEVFHKILQTSNELWFLKLKTNEEKAEHDKENQNDNSRTH